MPQAVDLPVSPGRSSKQVARANRTSEPTSRFDDILSNRSRVERSRESDSPAKSDEIASKKADRADRPEKSDKAEKKPKSEKPERDRIDDSDETAPESESTVAEETPDKPVADTSANEEAVVVEGVVEDQEEAPADASTDETADVVDPALAALAAAPSTEKPATDVATDSETSGEDTTASADPLDLSKLTAKPTADTHASGKTAQASDAEVADDVTDAGIQASGLKIPEDAANADADGSDADVLTQTAPATPDAAAASVHVASSAPAESEVDSSVQVQPATQSKPVAPATPIAQPQAVQHPDDRFVEQNVDRIVTGIKSDLTPNGGTMKIRLDPPNLGQLNIDVTVDEGVLTASFTTTNEEATRLLSHSMQQLKHTLESAGVSVDKIQVRQTSSSEQPSNSRSGDQDQQQQQNAHDHPQRQEQQRREALQKMWAKLSLGEEPLDLVA